MKIYAAVYDNEMGDWSIESSFYRSKDKAEKALDNIKKSYVEKNYNPCYLSIFEWELSE